MRLLWWVAQAAVLFAWWLLLVGTTDWPELTAGLAAAAIGAYAVHGVEKRHLAKFMGSSRELLQIWRLPKYQPDPSLALRARRCCASEPRSRRRSPEWSVHVHLRMRTVRNLATAVLAAGSLILIACAHHPSASAPAYPGSRPSTGVTNKQNAADTRVVDQIADARCDREAKCGNIGAGKTYERRDLCLDAMRGKTAPDLTAYKCPLGIDQTQLDACFKQLREQSCSFSLAHLFSADQCSESALCVK